MPPIKKKSLLWVIEKILDEPEHSIQIDRLDGFLPFSVSIPKLDIYDAKGHWLSLQQIDIKISWIPFTIDFIKLQAIDVKRPTTFQSTTFDFKAFLSLLLKQRFLKEFQVHLIRLDRSLLGQDYQAELHLWPDSMQGQNVDLKTSLGSCFAHIIQKDSSQLVLKRMQIESQDWTVKGEMEVSPVNSTVIASELRLSLHHKNLLKPLPIIGSVAVDIPAHQIRTSGTLDCSDIPIHTVTGRSLKWSMLGQWQPDKLTLTDLNITGENPYNLKGEGEFHPLTGTLHGAFNLMLPSFNQKAPQELTINLTGNLDKPQVNFKAKTPQTYGIISWDRKKEDITITLKSQNLQWPTGSFSGVDFKTSFTPTLTGQASLKIGSGRVKGISFNKIDIASNFDHGQGSYTLDIAPGAQGLAASVKGKGHFILGQVAPSQIHGDIIIQTFIARSKKKSGHLAKKTLTLHNQFKWTMSQLEWHTIYQPTAPTPLKIDGLIHLTEGKILDISPWKVQTKGIFNLSALTPWLVNGDRISGKLQADLLIEGTWSVPRLHGILNINKGFYEIAEFGTCIGNIDLEIQAKGSHLNILKLVANDGTKRAAPQGQITGQGSLDLKELFNPFLDIKLSVTDFQVAASDSFFARADGNVTLKGFSDKAKIEGNISLEPAKLSIEEINDTPNIPVIRLANTPVELQAHSTPKSELKIFPIALKLHTPKRFMIQGFGLESLWEGDMEVIGYLSDTQLTGAIHIVKGKLDLFGKVMKITQGHIRYDQTIKNDPYLYVIALREIDGISIHLVIEGRVSNPRFTFLSAPALPQEEILSRLLFGKELNKISVGQSLQLATALASMKGQKSLNIMDKIRSTFGLDSLELKENKDDINDRTSQAVSVGKEFGNTRISIDQAITTGTSKASVSTALTPSLNLDIDIGGSTSSGVGLSWTRRY